jgi:serine protease Do
MAVVFLTADWTPIADKLSKSVVYIEAGQGRCTGFIVNADRLRKDQKVDLVLTAEHCNGTAIFADHETATVIWKDTHSDLMLLEVEDTGRPALVIAEKNPKQGQEIGSFGHGYGLEKPMFRHAYVSNAAIDLPELEGGPFVMIDAPFVPGQSGGPVIDEHGEVVSIVQQASQTVGIGVGAEKIRDKIGRYLPKP